MGPAAASGDLRTTLTDAGTVLEGTLPAGAETRAFQSLAVVQFAARAEMSADGRTLTVDVGPERVGRAELRWGDRTYWLGDLPPGASTHAIDPSRLGAADGDSERRPASARGSFRRLRAML